MQRSVRGDDVGESTLWIKGFSTERTIAYLDAAATHVMSGSGVASQYETKSRGCTRAAKVVFASADEAQAVLKAHDPKRFDIRHDTALRIVRDRCASDRQRAWQVNRTVAKCASLAKQAGYQGLVELFGEKVFATLEDNLVILAHISPPWEDFSYELEATGMERIGVKSASVKQAVTELNGSSSCLRGDGRIRQPRLNESVYGWPRWGRAASPRQRRIARGVSARWLYCVGEAQDGYERDEHWFSSLGGQRGASQCQSQEQIRRGRAEKWGLRRVHGRWSK